MFEKNVFGRKLMRIGFFALERADLHWVEAGQILPVRLSSVWNFDWTGLPRERRLRDRRT